MLFWKPSPKRLIAHLPVPKIEELILLDLWGIRPEISGAESFSIEYPTQPEILSKHPDKTVPQVNVPLDAE